MNFLVLSAAKFTGLCSGSSRTQTQGPWQWLQLPLPCGSIQLGGGGDRPRPRQNQLDPPPLEEGFGAVWGIASTAVGSHPRPLTPGSCGKDNVLITLPAQLCRTSEGGTTPHRLESGESAWPTDHADRVLGELRTQKREITERCLLTPTLPTPRISSTFFTSWN